MRPFLPALLLALTVAANALGVSVVPPPATPGPNPKARAALASLETVSQPWKAIWDLDTGDARVLYNGETLRGAGAATDQARAFLTANRALFGLGDTDGLKVERSVPHMLGETVRFRQTVGGIPVYPGEVTVTRDGSRRIVFVASDIRPVAGVSPTPALNAADAAAQAVRETGGGRPGTPELVIYARAKPYRLAWKVDVDTAPNRRERVLIDAATGGIIERSNLIAGAAGQGSVYIGNPVSTPSLTDVPIVRLNDPAHLTGQFVEVRKFSQYDGTGKPQGALDLTAPNGDFRLPASDPRINQVMMYFHVDRWHAYFKSAFGFTGRDSPMPAFAEVTAQGGGPLNNAFFSPVCDCLSFGHRTDGTDYALDADVIGHEYTHSVVDKLDTINAGPAPWSEPRAMNEAYADYFSATVQGEACMSELLSGKTDGSCGRDLTNRKHYPEEVGQSLTTKDGVHITEFPEEHSTGEIWGAALWDLRRTLGATLADRVVFGSLPPLTSESGFSAARVALQTAAKQLGGVEAENFVKQVFDNRGIPEQPTVDYAQPNVFSFPNGAGPGIVTGYVNPTTGDFTRIGFLPAYVAGRTHAMIGIMDPVPDAKTVALLLLDSQNKVVLQFPASLADVKVNTANGKADLKRFLVFAKIPADKAGSYKFTIGTSKDGTNFSFGGTVAGKVIADAGPTPAPPRDIASTPPNPIPDSDPTPPPATPASVTVSPPTAQVNVGGETAFTAQVFDPQNKVVPNASVTWSLEGAGATDRANVSPNGILRAKGEGAVTVVASVGAAVRGQASVQIVTPPPVAGVEPWQFVAGSENATVVWLSASAGGGQSIVYAAATDKVLASHNQAAFGDVTAGIAPGAVFSSITANPANPQSVFVATLNRGVFHSANAGGTWAEQAGQLFDTARSAYPVIVSVDSEPADNIAVGTLDQGAFVIGANGTAAPFSQGLTFGTVKSFIQNLQTGTVFAGTTAGAFRRRINTGTWEGINTGLVAGGIEGNNSGLPPSVNRLVLNPQNPSELLAATNSDGVFYSANEGDLWTQAVNGLDDRTIYAVAFDPLVPGRIFCGTLEDGVYVSPDRGAHWQSARTGLPTGIVTSLVFDPTLKQFLLAGTLGSGVWALDTSKTIVAPPFTPGDVNGDNALDVVDAVTALQVIVGIVPSTPEIVRRGDLNADAQITVQDVVLLLQKVVGIGGTG